MTKIIASALVALALVGGAASANAQSNSIMVHGYLGTAYGK